MPDTPPGIAKPVRHFLRYTSEQRAGIAASFRLTQGQRSSLGEVFWTHPLVPGTAFTTRKAASLAAGRAAGGPDA